MNCHNLLQQFAQGTLQNPDLRQRLCELTDPLEFSEAVTKAGADQGYLFSSLELTAFMKANRRAWHRWNRAVGGAGNTEIAPTNIHPNSLVGCVPTSVYWQNGQPLVDWCYIGKTRFTDSFFEHTIQKCMRLPINQFARPITSIKTVRNLVGARPALQPSGFIFHMSRCGSTLVSQMLAASPKNHVISEAPALDGIVQANVRSTQLSPAEHLDWLRCMVCALGQGAQGNQSAFYIKLDCHHTLALPLFRQAFPEVPWIFIYRNPVEVLVSQLRARGAVLLPNVMKPEFLGWSLSKVEAMTLNEYTAALLGTICQRAGDFFGQGGGRLINYRQLPDAFSSIIAPHFELRFSPEDKAVLAQTIRQHAKNPIMPFAEDSEAKCREATPEVHQLVERYLAQPYTALEMLRQNSFSVQP